MQIDIIPKNILHSGVSIPHPINERLALAPKQLCLGAGKSLTKKLSTTEKTSGIMADALMQSPGRPSDLTHTGNVVAETRCCQKKSSLAHNTQRSAIHMQRRAKAKQGMHPCLGAI